MTLRRRSRRPCRCSPGAPSSARQHHEGCTRLVAVAPPRTSYRTCSGARDRTVRQVLCDVGSTGRETLESILVRRPSTHALCHATIRCSVLSVCSFVSVQYETLVRALGPEASPACDVRPLRPSVSTPASRQRARVPAQPTSSSKSKVRVCVVCVSGLSPWVALLQPQTSRRAA